MAGDKNLYLAIKPAAGFSNNLWQCSSDPSPERHTAAGHGLRSLNSGISEKLRELVRGSVDINTAEYRRTRGWGTACSAVNTEEKLRNIVRCALVDLEGVGTALGIWIERSFRREFNSTGRRLEVVLAKFEQAGRQVVSESQRNHSGVDGFRDSIHEVVIFGGAVLRIDKRRYLTRLMPTIGRYAEGYGTVEDLAGGVGTSSLIERRSRLPDSVEGIEARKGKFKQNSKTWDVSGLQIGLLGSASETLLLISVPHGAIHPTHFIRIEVFDKRI
ncbi:hypothetical protein B0H11DRAFT_1927173 [Mycena galericulata]|nr:hypothetical protein B0H11DRAFT_1927173 [Mycena galericulata]